MEHLVSVIVPIYNVEQYLVRCIDSICNQSYRNLEIILVDDGSPDGCDAICDAYAKKDSRIKVMHKANGGLSDARNAGLDVATGEYILLVDSDDWIHRQMIEILLKAAVQNSCELAICNFQYAYENCEYQDNDFDEKEILQKKQLIGRKQAQEIYFNNPNKRNVYTVAWNKLYHRRLFERIRYPKGKVHEDEYTTFKLLHEAEGICEIDVPMYYYFVREDSIMSTFKPSRFDIFDGYMEKIRYYLKWKEDNLACKMYFHAIHMMAQYQMWMDEAGVDYKDMRRKYCKMLSEIYHINRKRFQLTASQKVEKILFGMNFVVYFTFWKTIRKGRK